MIKIVETIAGTELIQVVDMDQLPATIGRGSLATYQVAQGLYPTKSPYAGTLSRIQATIYRENDQLWVKDGGDSKSANGIYLLGRRQSEPVLLTEGIEVELAPWVDNCRLTVRWMVPNEGDEFVTMTQANESLRTSLIQAIQEIAALKGESDGLMQELAAMQNSAALLTETVEENIAEVARVRAKNLEQDRQLLYFGAGACVMGGLLISVAWLLLGGDGAALKSLEGIAIGVIGLASAMAGLWTTWRKSA